MKILSSVFRLFEVYGQTERF